MKLLIRIGLISAGLVMMAHAQLVPPDWKAAAVKKYPELGVEGSALNRRFVEEYRQRQKSDPAFFHDQRWPLILADELTTGPSSGAGGKHRPDLASGSTNPTHLSQSGTGENEGQPAAATPAGWGWILFLGALVFLGICGSVSASIKRRRHHARLIRDLNEYIALAEEHGNLPSIPTSLLLKDGEKAFYHAESALYETRSVRNYQSGFTGFRLAKGVYVGGSRGRSVSTQQLTKIDTGELTVTNKRIIFNGGGADRTVPIAKILAIEPVAIEAVDLSVEGRQKSMVFQAMNPFLLTAIIRICSEQKSAVTQTQR